MFPLLRLRGERMAHGLCTRHEHTPELRIATAAAYFGPSSACGQDVILVVILTRDERIPRAPRLDAISPLFLLWDGAQSIDLDPDNSFVDETIGWTLAVIGTYFQVRA